MRNQCTCGRIRICDGQTMAKLFEYPMRTNKHPNKLKYKCLYNLRIRKSMNLHPFKNLIKKIQENSPPRVQIFPQFEKSCLYLI